jgi:hypothetical protein
MKMPKELYDYMLICMRTRAPVLQDYRKHLQSLGTVKDVEKRLRWDVCYDSIGARWICDNVYPLGMNDTHLDTALRKIIAEIELTH